MLGDKFLQKKYRQKKPRDFKIDILTVLDQLNPLLHTLKILKPGEQILAADLKDYKSSELTISIYTNKEVQSRTRKD